METQIESKDLRRLQDIKDQPGKEIGLATKQSKLIKDPEKATRRWLASVSIFGSDHPVTQIFRNRRHELDTGVVTPTVNVAIESKKTESQIVQENRITRKQEDFPIGCNVKFEDRKGKVVDHDILKKDSVRVEFENDTETVSIYNIKRC